MQMLSDYELLWTQHGRRWLREWCSKTRFNGGAEWYLKRLAAAEAEKPDSQCLP